MESNGGLMHLRVAEKEKSDCLSLLQRRRDIKTKTVEDKAGKRREKASAHLRSSHLVREIS